MLPVNISVWSDAPSRQTGLQTYGSLNTRKDNVILLPTFFSSQHEANEPMSGPGMALDPEKYFILVPNLCGNGLSLAHLTTNDFEDTTVDYTTGHRDLS